MTRAKLLVGEIEGRIIGEERVGTLQLQVNDDPDDWENLLSWFVNNLPQDGTYVRITVMSFPEV